MLKKLLYEWKSVIGYLVLQLLSDYPLVVTAAQQYLADPSKQNALNLLGQVILAVGVGHRLVKLVTKYLLKP